MKKFCILLLLAILFIAISACNELPAQPTDAPADQTTATATKQEEPTPPSTEEPQYDFSDGMPISEIQGAGHKTQYHGEIIDNIYGIVTTISGEGFYIQSPTPDDDPATSEGLFIYNPGLQRVKVGDLVKVTGKAVESYPDGGNGGLSITQITFADTEILSHDHPLPAPIVLGEGGRPVPSEIIDDDRLEVFDPENDGLDFFESLESMLVQINNPVAVNSINKYREIAFVANGGANATGFAERGVLTISETDYNPERLTIDDSLRSLPSDLPVGSTVEGDVLVGIVDYTFGMFKIQPIAKPKFIYASIEREVAAPAADGILTISAYNVENLDGADAQERFDTLALHIVNHLQSPDIIALSEVQDNDGPENSDVVEADLTYQRIIDAVTALGGPTYSYTDIAPKDGRDGGESGGNIRVGMLYRIDRGLSMIERPGGDAETPAQVLVSGNEVMLSISPGRIDPTNYAFSASRKPIAVEFSYNGNKLFVIAQHMNSKGGDTPLFGERQPPRLQSEGQRLQQAEVINAFVKEILAADSNAFVVVLGDLNDFQFSAPIQTLAGDELMNPIFGLEPVERYTYNYEGNAQALDHILISAGLNQFLSAFDIVHLNSEQAIDARFSDHDPVIAYFDLP